MDAKQYYNKIAQEWLAKKQSGPFNNYTHAFIEWPAVSNYLRGNVVGKRVLCIGCGSGEECQKFIELGATEVVGIDISDNLVSIARKEFPGIRFEVASWSDFYKIKDVGLFDIVYAGFSIHYVNNWNRVCNDVSRVLIKKGKFIFSDTHPFKNLERIIGKT